MHGLAILSFSRKWKSGIVPTGGICARFWSPSVGWLEFLYLLCSSLILLNTIQTNFPVYDKNFSKRASWLEQNTWKFCTEPLLMVYKIDWLFYYFATAQFVKPEVRMFISRAHVSWVLSESSNTVELSSHPRSLIMMTYINFHYLLPG